MDRSGSQLLQLWHQGALVSLPWEQWWLSQYPQPSQALLRHATSSALLLSVRQWLSPLLQRRLSPHPPWLLWVQAAQLSPPLLPWSQLPQLPQLPQLQPLCSQLQAGLVRLVRLVRPWSCIHSFLGLGGLGSLGARATHGVRRERGSQVYWRRNCTWSPFPGMEIDRLSWQVSTSVAFQTAFGHKQEGHVTESPWHCIARSNGSIFIRDSVQFQDLQRIKIYQVLSSYCLLQNFFASHIGGHYLSPPTVSHTSTSWLDAPRHVGTLSAER